MFACESGWVLDARCVCVGGCMNSCMHVKQYFSTYDSQQMLLQYLVTVTEISYIRDPLFVCELSVLSRLVSGLQQI